MSIKLPRGPNDPTINVISSLENLFDPRKNPYFFRDPSEVTVGLFFSWLKALYTKENLLAHPEAFFSYCAQYATQDTYSGIAQRMIEVVPEEDLWVYYFCRQEPYDMRVSLYGSFTPLRSPSYVEFIMGDDLGSTEWRTRSHYPNDAFAAEWSAKISGIASAYRTLFEANLDRKWSSVNSSRICGQFMVLLTYYMQGRAFYPAGNASQLAASLQSNSSDIRIVFHPSAVCDLDHIEVVVPVTKTNRAPLYKLFNYTTNPLSMLQYPLLAKGEHEPVLYGVELEMSTAYEIKELVDVANETFFLMKSDGSITGKKRNAYEMVTVPMSLKAHKREWAHWFSKIDYDKFDTSVDTNNGMHVHIDRKAFEGQQHLRNFCWFITQPAHSAFMLILSERGNVSSMQSFAASPTFHQYASKAKAFKNVCAEVQRIRGAVNLKKGPTVEVRIFRGIVSFASVLKNLEAVDAMLHYTKEAGLNKMTLNAFFAWLENTPRNKYMVLKKFLQTVPLAPVLVAAEVSNIIFTETNEDKIVKLFNNSGIKVTNEHVKVLNKGKKRTYILNKDTGKVELTGSNKGKVSFLDRDLEARYLRSMAQVA